ncbi:endonuclease [Aquimarina algicola]|uniref:T9SS type A sorting domain-containing protein n=1 Tax=Aquimarina algicola TaxID=2589995 RepID=A0A504J6N8_9FLAO|nr:endonuclease [Aquimarina algicola]TPN82380.1 T9SS type A sorting domain-containing protein [Aquimarina algicola]
MKKLLGLLLIIPTLIYSQIPSYYNDINLNVSGTQLKNVLSEKITNTHTNFLSYTPGVWDALKQTDIDLTNASKVLLVYGYNDLDGDSTNDRTRGINDNGGGSNSWNREHVYPKSLGNPNLGTSGPGADAHHLRPADTQRNSSRGNRKFGDGSGNSGATSQGHWYPGDEWKGDVARMMMYMYLRYGNRCLPKNVGVGASVSGDNNMIDLFLQWNVEDPVSQFELQRNPILENLQGNRNPFIDNPAFATKIWGGPQAEDRFGNSNGSDTQAPSTPTALVASNINTNSISLSWNASTDNVGVTGYDIYRNGILVSSSNTASYTVTALVANTSYSFFVRAKDAAGNISNASATIDVTTLSGPPTGGSGELFFSEYIEGSSNNKAIEIANFTGTSVNLSEYSIKKQINGAGSWSSTLNLSGTLASGDVFVIANASATSGIKNEADLVTSSSAVTFNGNDPVGLFKNDVLIDIIGIFDGGSTNFAQNMTLRRKADISTPSTSFTISNWDSYSQDTFSGLGKHTKSSQNNQTSYCTSKGNTTTYEYIDHVEIGGISNTTVANNGYGDFTSQTAQLSYGRNTIVLSAGFTGTPYAEYWRVWIDFNKNGVFETSELMVDESSSSDSQLSYDFNIPSSVSSGETRMRIAMKWDSASTPCETFGYGEVEDYTIILNTSTSQSLKTNLATLQKQEEEFLITIHPNPASEYIQINGENTLNSQFKITNMVGVTVKSGKVTNDKISLDNLRSGVYFINVSNDEYHTSKTIIIE